MGLCKAKILVNHDNESFYYYKDSLCAFEIQFMSLQSETDLRSLEPFKYVKMEQLNLNWMSLVGNVGGTLGMIIGFSFMVFFEWVSSDCVKMVGHVARFLKTPMKIIFMHRQNTVPTLFKPLLRIGLSICAFLFVQQSIADFWRGKTSYLVTTEPISTKDIPSLTICLEYHYSHGTTHNLPTYGKD